MKYYDMPSDFAEGAKNLCGRRVRILREQASKPNRRKMTQTELSAKLQLLGVECDRLAICRIETGARSVSDIELVALAKALNVPVDVLLFGKESTEE